MKKLKEGSAKPLKIKGTVTIEVVMRQTEYADAAEVVPGIERIDAYIVRYPARDTIEAYKVIEALAYVVLGVENIKARLSG